MGRIGSCESSDLSGRRSEQLLRTNVPDRGGAKNLRRPGGCRAACPSRATADLQRRVTGSASWRVRRTVAVTTIGMTFPAPRRLDRKLVQRFAITCTSLVCEGGNQHHHV